jgi:NAD-dependent dihydropyrimidine dehydrogenase PreA subunit
MTELSYRMIYIGGAPAGLLGLEELFDDLFTSGLDPEHSDLPDSLIKGVRQHNFLPKPAIGDYQEVLIREYQKYYRDRSGGKAVVARDYGQWEGFPREHIPWFPVVSAELCNGCGKCIEVCPKEVFETKEDGKVEVVEPFLCIVGCCFCKSACDPKAILMPNRSMLDQFHHGQRPST